MNNYPFQYAVLRYIHDLVTEEFLNIGVVVYCKEQRYLKCMTSKKYRRLSNAFNGIERINYARMISNINHKIEYLSSQLAKVTFFDSYPDQIQNILEQVLIPNDASVTFGGYGAGIARDLDAELNRLYYRLVEKYIEIDEPESRTDQEVWSLFFKSMQEHGIQDHLAPVRINAPTYGYDFEHAYKNDKWHPIEPVSFDLVHPRSILEKANKWIGNAAVLSDSEEIGTLYLLIGKPRRKVLHEAYENAVYNLRTKITGLSARIVLEEEADQFSEELEKVIQEHS